MPAPPPLSDVQAVRNHIDTLSKLNTRLQTLRHIPSLLLRPPVSGVHVLPQASLLRHEFQELKEIADTVRSEQVQDALKAARTSEAAEPKMVGFDVRRDNLKRRHVIQARSICSNGSSSPACASPTTVCRRPPSPESPQPYRATGPKSNSFLPRAEEGVVPVTLDRLPAFIREHNKANRSKLHVVAPKKGRPLQCPLVLRFVITDVVTIYLSLEHSAAGDQALVVESATAFGPREQKAIHSQSDYSVYQQLSQQLARVLQSEPWAPLQEIVSLLWAYENLFTEPCVACGRVLSADVHTPPVLRARKEAGEDSPSEWGVYHVACKSR
ncbi:hypothetical protein C2E23DRAFT_716748 [Lenzites betulinus]|nr:hypothetical protein C2E23DRAFT_716748 [Lenzites betulinus]